ncbi:MAG: GNAT family N-acetyltransferase [Nitrospirae bacterium]|nr:GNAT family N-acetyltransferase [Nitrospirota bacterium]
MVDAGLITNDESFKELEPEWNGLLAESDRSTPFMSWDWASTWWKHFGTGRLHVLTLRRNGKLFGIAPLHRVRGPWGMDSLQMLGTGQSDYLDFLVPKKDADPCYLELLRHLIAEGGFDLILLEQVPPNRLEIIKETGQTAGAFLQIKERGHCYFVRLPSKWEDYLAGLGKNERYNIGRRTRTLEREHHVTFRRLHQPGAELDHGVKEFFGLMTRRLTMRGRRLAAEEETSLRFHREMAVRFAERGWMNLSLLEQKGRMIAGLFAFEQDQKLFYYHSGFDPDWAKHSVGMVLLAKCIEDGIGRGLREFDFMRGRAEYKSKWKVEERPFYKVAIARDAVSYVKYIGHGVTTRLQKKWNKTLVAVRLKSLS